MSALSIVPASHSPNLFTSLPVTNFPKLFAGKGYDKEKDAYIFRLDTSKLRTDRFHFFYVPTSQNEYSVKRLAIFALEHITFNSTNTEASKNFTVVAVNYASVKVIWCSFPKTFKDAFINAAKLFDLKVVQTPSTSVWTKSEASAEGQLRTLTVHFQFPQHKALLHIQDNGRIISKSDFNKQLEELKVFGVFLEETGVDR